MREIMFRGRMREIIFRGKTVKSGEWLYGSLIKTGESCFIWPVDSLGLINGQDMRVLRETVGQFTGVCDRNDKPVYEGDIVKLDKLVKMFFALADKGVVEYDHGAFFVSKHHTKVNNLFALTDGLYILRGEVIGNIFDNPELLKDLEEGIEK